MSERPRSAFRRPQPAARQRPAPAAPAPEPEVFAEADGEAWWLFKTAYRLTTTDIALAGFTQCVLLDAARWCGGDEDLTPEMCAASEVAYTLGFPEDVTPQSITAEWKGTLCQALGKAFVGRGGDLLIIFQNAITAELGGDGQGQGAGKTNSQGMSVVCRVVDAINQAYAAADAQGLPDLAVSPKPQTRP
mmetsp:Transcript_69868/g.221375  ORF Transcript_69868/g.221375 Transcript_69868/m.221375 type:complete len:190 (-) Transcript_69868:30-599(-)